MIACTPSLQGGPLWEHSDSREGEGPLEDRWRVATGDRVCLGVGPLLGSYCDKSHSSWWWSSQEGTCDPEFLWRLPIWQMRGFRGSPPASMPFRCLQLKIVSTSETEQDPMVLVGLPPTPWPCPLPAFCLQKNFSQRICFIREVRTCRSKGKLVKQGII